MAWAYCSHARAPYSQDGWLCLDGRLPKTRPPGGPRKRLRDQICKDLKVVGISESEWYDEATSSKEGWCATYRPGLGTSFGHKTNGRSQLPNLEQWSVASAEDPLDESRT